MKNKKLFLLVIFVILFNLVTACSLAAIATPTETATSTPIPVTPTNTPKPTSTPSPTMTPDVVSTQMYGEFNTLLQKIEDGGYISTTGGETFELESFKESWAQINYFDIWPYQMVDSDFVLKAKFNWSTASSKPDSSGCGVVFGGQENGDYYIVFLTNSNLRFFLKRGENLYNVGKANGSGVANFGNPAEAEFVLAVSDQKAHVWVDDEYTLYMLSVDQTTKGVLGLSLLSGTNNEYGTSCEASDMMLWTAE